MERWDLEKEFTIRKRRKRRKGGSSGRVTKCDYCALPMKLMDRIISAIHPAGNTYPRKTVEGKRVETHFQRLCRACRRRAVQHRTEDGSSGEELPNVHNA